MYSRFCRGIYFPVLHGIKRIPYDSVYAEASRNQWLKQGELSWVNAQKLDFISKFARENSKYYSRFSGQFPLLLKSDIAMAGNEMLTEMAVGNSYLGVTSGSTGVPLTFYQDSSHYAWTEACMDRCYEWWGVQKGARKLVLWGRPIVGARFLQTKSWIKHRLQNVLSFNTFRDLTEEYLSQIAKNIFKFKPAVIYGYGSSIGALALYMQSQKMVVPKEWGLRLVQYTGDSMMSSEKEIASTVFGVKVSSLYASSEASSLSYECPHGGLHRSIDHIHVEFLRPDGSSAGPDEPADIVITTLNNYAMPLIRYKIGDIGSYSNRVCSCGLSLPLMNLEIGKIADRISTSSKQQVSSYVLDYIAKHITRVGMPGIKSFQVEQTGLDQFILNIVKSENYQPSTVDFFVSKMREYLGPSISVSVEFREFIPISKSGKRSWFIKSA